MAAEYGGQDKVPVGTALKYGVGQVGAQIFRDTPAVLLPIFMTTMLGIQAWIAGLVILIPKLWVIVCDPLVGSYSDRKEATHGRAPILLVGAVLASLGFLGLFAFTTYSSPTLAAVAICLIYLLATTGFSAFSVPYLAMAAELSADPHERTKVLVYRMLFTYVGLLLGVGVAQPMVQKLGGGAYGWQMMSYLFAGICLVTMAATALGLWRFRAKVTGTPKPQNGLMQQMAIAWRNRPFFLLMFTHFIQSIAQACSYSVLGLVFMFAVGNVNLLFPFMVSMMVAGMASQPLWLAGSKRFGKMPMFLVACFGWAAITVTWIWVGSAGDAHYTLPLLGTLNIEEVLALVRGLAIGVTNSGFILLAVSLLTDTMNHKVDENEASNEGSLAGVWSASEKLAFAFGPAISGAMLSWFGFQASTGGAVSQSESAVRGILLCYSLIPAAIFIVALVFMKNYTASFGRKA